jgi:hypothetical protein
MSCSVPKVPYLFYPKSWPALSCVGQYHLSYFFNILHPPSLFIANLDTTTREKFAK